MGILTLEGEGEMWQATKSGSGEGAMPIPIELLAQQVLQLPAQDRARLLDQVIGSLDADRERDARWNALAAERDAEADASPSVLVAGPEAVARIRAGLE